MMQKQVNVNAGQGLMDDSVTSVNLVFGIILIANVVIAMDTQTSATPKLEFASIAETTQRDQNVTDANEAIMELL